MPETARAVTGVGWARAGGLDCGPHLVLELGGVGVDSLEVGLVAGAVEGNAQVEILVELGADAGGVGGGERPARTYSVPMALASASS